LDKDGPWWLIPKYKYDPVIGMKLALASALRKRQAQGISDTLRAIIWNEFFSKFPIKKE